MTGPLAGIVYRNAEGVAGWYSVSPQGHMWRLHPTGDAVPSLSPDGSHLGYLRGSFLGATYVIVNQVDGTTTSFPQIGTGAHNADIEDFDDDHRFFHSDQSPAFWSPDGTNLLLRIGLNDPEDPEPDPAAAVLGTDGTLQTIPEPVGAAGANPVGWVDEHHVVLLAGADTEPTEVRVWIVDIRSGLVARDFILDGGESYGETYQWFGSISPDGNQLAAAPAHEDDAIRFYSMREPTEGDLVATMPAIPVAAEGCQSSWSSSDHYLPTRTTRDGESAVLVRTNGGVTIVADPRLDIVCSTWARSALDGPAHSSIGTRLFGHQNTWLSWHWREVSGSVLFAIAVTLGIGLRVRRRTRSVS